MKTLKISLATLALTLVTNLTYGQTEKSPSQTANSQTEAMAERYILTPDQKAKIAEINLAIAQKNQGVKMDAQLSEETKAQSYKGNNDARVQMIKSVLTLEQAEKFTAEQNIPLDKPRMQTKEVKTNMPVASPVRETPTEK